MKVLLYALNFSPELIGIGKYVGEMADWLSKQGHDVRVVCAPPYYPEWKVAQGYRRYWYSTEQWRGVKVFRAPLYVPKFPTGLKRILHLASFAITSIPLLLRQTFWSPDVVWVVEPPLFCSPAAAIFAKMVGARSWLHIQDFEVSAGFSLGLLKSKILRSLVLGAERFLMRRFDVVSSISVQMLKQVDAKLGKSTKLRLFPNWVDTKAIRPDLGTSRYRTELGISSNKVVALYSGTMGLKQGLEFLGGAAVLLQDHPNLELVFCGTGPRRAELVEQCKGLANVHFMELQPVERLGELLALADIHLLPQRSGAADLMLPSKLTGMLASGRPIIATATSDTDLGRVVQNCGLIL